MKDDGIAIGVLEEADVTNACVDRLSEELDAFGLELLARFRDVVDSQAEARLVRLELEAVLLGIPEGQGDIRRLDLGSGVPALRETEDVAVELDGSLHVEGRDRDEIDLLNL